MLPVLSGILLSAESSRHFILTTIVNSIFQKEWVGIWALQLQSVQRTATLAGRCWEWGHSSEWSVERWEAGPGHGVPCVSSSVSDFFFLNRSRQACSLKSQIVTILGFAGHVVLVAATRFCCCSAKVATMYKHMSWLCSNKTLLRKTNGKWAECGQWPVICWPLFWKVVNH